MTLDDSWELAPFWKVWPMIQMKPLPPPELSKDEKKHIKEALRNGLHLKAVRLSELKKTNRLTYVVNSQNEIVTAFPGRYAPPLPFPEMPFDEKKNATEFWLNHVFVELT